MFVIYYRLHEIKSFLFILELPLLLCIVTKNETVLLLSP